MSWNKIIECVPNFSEGRDLEKIDKIISPFRARAGVKLLDYSNDEDHNRLVVTLVGEPEALRDAIIEAVGVAVALIDLNHHTGQHPRMGAVDVIPFIQRWMRLLHFPKKWGQRWQNFMGSLSSYMRNQLLPLIVRIWLLFAKVNLRVWQRR